VQLLVIILSFFCGPKLNKPSCSDVPFEYIDVIA